MLGIAARDRPDPCIDERRFEVVDPQACGVIGPNDEIVIPRLRRQDSPFPADRKSLGVNLFGIRTRLAEIEANLTIDSIKYAVTGSEAKGLEICRLEAAR